MGRLKKMPTGRLGSGPPRTLTPPAAWIPGIALSVSWTTWAEALVTATGSDTFPRGTAVGYRKWNEPPVGLPVITTLCWIESASVM